MLTVSSSNVPSKASLRKFMLYPVISKMNSIQLRNACRLCLFTDSNNVDILGEEGRRQRYQQKIWKHLSLWVCIEDTLPTAICQLCCDRLEEFHSFVLKVEEVQQNIHRMLYSQSYGTTNCVSHILNHRKFQSDQIGDISVKADMNKSVNNSEVSQDVPSCSRNFRNDNENTTSNNVAKACVIKSSPNSFSHLQEQCFVQTDTETDGINETDVEYIKVEADPLQIENYDTGSAEDTVHIFSDTIRCESPRNELLYRLLTSDKRCVYSQDASAVSTACDTPSETVHYRNNKKVADKTLIPIDNLRNKCHRNSVSKAGESDVEEVQVSTATKTQGRIRNTAASSEPGSQSDSGCSVPSERRNDSEESENNVHTHPSELSMYTRLSRFYNYSCKICEPQTATFSSFFLLCKHYRSKHNTKGYVICCGRKLMSKHLVVSHMLQHLQPGIYKCQECGKELASELTYERHIIHHLPEDKRPFKCEHCLRGFVSKGNLRAHLRSHLPDTEKYAFACKTCGKKFATQGGVTAHQRNVHDRVCEFMCHICPKTFPTQGTLKGHLYSHVAKSEQKQCQECGKWLKSDLTLRVHMRSHSGRVFRCPHCNKAFHDKQRMCVHMRSHSSTHPYKCLVCGKTFKLRSGLRTHAVQHTGEKPYQCLHCPRTFASSGNYHKHKKRMHTSEKLCNVT